MTVRTPQHLVEYIRCHGHVASLQDEQTISVLLTYTYRDGSDQVQRGEEWEIIPAQYQAVRDWLGY